MQKNEFMKNLLFVIIALVITFQSCTIQKRQHLPGYYIEWNSANSHSVCEGAKSENNAPIREVNSVVYEGAVPDVVNEIPSCNEAEYINRIGTESFMEPSSASVKEKNVDRTPLRKVNFPNIIHSPSKLLFGGHQPEDGKRTDGMCIASMVCGIISFFVPLLGLVLAILAIIFGGVGLGRTRRDPELRGRGMAITGLVLGIIGMFFVLLLLTLLSLSFAFTI